jgi:uncharacterized protein
MTIEDVLRETKIRVRNAIPASVDITDVEFEGALLVIYTKHPDKFADLGDSVRHLAKMLQKRLVIRPDPSVLQPIEQAERKIREILPEDVELTNIYWEPDIGEVTIECAKPGRAIGPGGSILNDLKRAIGWAPKIIRTPPMPSKTIHEVRGYIRTMGEERKRILRTIGRRLHRGASRSGKSWLRMTTLGGYREIGRGCTLLQTQDSKVLIDVGSNPSDPTVRPFVESGEVSPIEGVDAVVVTSAKLEQAGMLPLLYKMGFDGPVYCTAPTRDLMTLLQVDYIKGLVAEGKTPPYGAEEIREVIKHTITLNYGDTTDITPDMRLTLYNAGHIVGSSIAHFHVGDGFYNMAFTGAIKYERGWLFNQAQNRFPRLESIIMEATYGGANDLQLNRKQASQTLRDVCRSTLERGGHVLIPVYPSGRAQEVMLALEFLIRNKQLPGAVVHLDGMVWEATAIHTAYPEFLNDQLRSQVFQPGQNPFTSEVFQRVDSAERRAAIFESEEPTIVLAPAGNLTSGPVLDYLRAWGGDPKSTLLFPGFVPEGTLGRQILEGLREIPGLKKREEPAPEPTPPKKKKATKAKKATKTTKTKKAAKAVKPEPEPPATPEAPERLRMAIEFVDGFSGHSDRRQLLNFVGNMSPRPDRVFLSSGEGDRSQDLAAALRKKYNIETAAPMNLESIRFR